MRAATGIYVRTAVVLFAVVGAQISFAKDPCASELCLSYKANAKQIAMCKPPADDFFSIKKKRHGVFDPAGTYKARRDYLYSCDSGNTDVKEQILAVYGSVVKW